MFLMMRILNSRDSMIQLSPLLKRVFFPLVLSKPNLQSYNFSLTFSLMFHLETKVNACFILKSRERKIYGCVEDHRFGPTNTTTTLFYLEKFVQKIELDIMVFFKPEHLKSTLKPARPPKKSVEMNAANSLPTVTFNSLPDDLVTCSCDNCVSFMSIFPLSEFFFLVKYRRHTEFSAIIPLKAQSLPKKSNKKDERASDALE
ncbi:hypothetical protein EGR_02346 [Echinococcus granulosus]|uniref:Uncharacterized protein n=1 Tax=Echinococcus granulosus TaxID=6210 RepID=W6UMV6_ECHGR|nr:hypothetical protein EGR_02346 [Echinococcus granulosus]EUB62905.1 hypothetical protein EGR_02346 [Echinococcus granulosus]